MLMQFSMALHLEMKILNICELSLSGRLHIINNDEWELRRRHIDNQLEFQYHGTSGTYEQKVFREAVDLQYVKVKDLAGRRCIWMTSSYLLRNMD